MKFKALAFICSLLLAGPAASAQQTTFLTPIGLWSLCADGITIFPGCDGYQPGAGTETYMLMIGGPSPAVAYSWTVTATLANGSVKTLTGVIMRSDNAAGFTAALPLVFGGVVGSSTITVEDLVIVAVRAAIGKR
jgi:hypothetical protein